MMKLHSVEVKTLTPEIFRMFQVNTALLTAGEERVLAEYTAGLESKKWDQETLSAFLDAVEAALVSALERDPARTLALLEHLRQIRRAVPFHVGAGHLFGWLAAGRPM